MRRCRQQSFWGGALVAVYALILGCSSHSDPLSDSSTTTNGKIYGSVVFPDDSRASSSHLRLRSLDVEPQQEYRTRTNADGEFSFDSLAYGSYLIDAVDTSGNDVFWSLQDVLLTEEQNARALPFWKIQRTGALSGIALYMDRYPGLSLTVYLQFNGHTIAQTVAEDSTGTFAFPQVPPATYSLLCVPSDKAYVSFTEQNITIESGKTVSVTVGGLIPASELRSQESFVNDSLALMKVFEANNLDLPAQGYISIGSDFHIEELRLKGLGLTTMPGDIAKLKHLRKLDLSNNSLVTLPETIDSLQGLELLWLDNNHLSSIPTGVGALRSLRELRLAGNECTYLPGSIGRLRSLRVLSVSRNQLSSLPDSIVRLDSLASLFADENYLSSLPKRLGNLKSLHTLTLFNNNIRDLPVSITRLSELEKLGLSRNAIGRLPSGIGALRRLEDLSIDHNHLDTLNDEIVNCRSLVYLRVSGNLVRSVPASICSLPALKVLLLDSNKISALPAEFPLLSDLRTLKVRGNTLCDLDSELRQFLNARDPSWRTYQRCTADTTVFVIDRPRAGDVYRPGEKMSIRWHLGAGSPSISAVNIAITSNGGLTWYPVLSTAINQNDPEWGNLVWTIPESLSVTGLNRKIPLVSNECMIRIEYYYEKNLYGQSGMFSIVPRESFLPIEVVSPNGGETYGIGDTLEITWKADTSRVLAVMCSLSVDDGDNYVRISPINGLLVSATGLTTFYWPVTGTLVNPDTQSSISTRSSSCRIKISDFFQCIEGGTDCFGDTSNEPFSIGP